MSGIRYFCRNLLFLTKKILPACLILLAISLIAGLSGLFYSIDNSVVAGDIYFIDINASILPAMTIIFSFVIAFNYYRYVKSYNISLRYSNIANMSICISFCLFMSLIFGISVYLIHIIAYLSFEQIVPIVYDIDFILVLQGMTVIFMYSLLGSAIGYFLIKLTDISGFFYILVGIYVFIIFYAIEQGGFARDDDNFVLQCINFIMAENNLGLLTAKALPISIAVFSADHCITELRGVR